MLVLSRKLGEKVVVPQCGLSVTVQHVQGNRVQLAISAPPELAVHREEVWRDMQAAGAVVADAEPTKSSTETLAAEMSDAAYQIALREGLAKWWIDLELALWRASAEIVSNWNRRFPRLATKPEPAAADAQPIRLPR